MSLISGIAQDIFENELDSTGVTLVSVSGWLSEYFGALNTLLNTQFSGVAGEVANFNQEEKDIYKELYLHHYYKKQARNALIKIVNDNAGNIISVQDGDNSITFTNKNEVSKLQSELDELRDVVKYLRSKLNEVNLLNAKLLFTNKLFRAFGLSNDQKMKVVENFDRATNLREVKLVYSTLAESFGTKVEKKEIKESKGRASKPVASTKSE